MNKKSRSTLEKYKSELSFDIERGDLYDCTKPELKERTRTRLTKIAECGMEEVMTAEFGYKGVMSGLYIERVWADSDETFADYMQWAKGLIAASVSGSGYPIHICDNEENTMCGVDLKTKGISWVKNTQLHTIKHDGLCYECSKLHYRTTSADY